MKLGIITFHNAHNYGACLQVYASQTLLTRLGYDCEVINYRVRKIDRSYEASPARRKRAFEHFISTRLHLSPLYSSLQELRDADLTYDILYAGSDQIWNSSLLGGLNAAYFCDFGRTDARRIIYGASPGTEALSAKDRFLMLCYLQYPDFLSVREESALPLLQPLTEKPIAVVLDPTFLLPLTDYTSLLVPVPVSTPYIYLHYVHYTGENPELDRAAEQLSALTGLPIIKNRSGKRFSRELASCPDIGPEEFLSYLQQAAFVISDSFHATVFSILFSKRFLTVPPVKRPERLFTLLRLLKLEAHLYHADYPLPDFPALPDYRTSVEAILEPLRQSSLEYLKNALSAPIVDSALPFPVSANPFRCCGCGACLKRSEAANNTEQAQTKNAHATLMLAEDAEGFLYPSGKLSSDSCTWFRADLVLPEHPDIFLAYHTALYERMCSYEGGLLPAFFSHMQKNGGVVIAAAYDSASGQNRYRLASTAEESNAFLSFRPQEANPEELFSLLATLPKNQPVLLLAPPCLLAARQEELRALPLRIITMDLFFPGIISKKTVRAYFDVVEKVSGKPVIDYNLCAKHYGKTAGRVEFTHSDGSLTSRSEQACLLLKAYRAGKCQRPSSYTSPFRSRFPGTGDLSLALPSGPDADAFAPEDKSISLISINTNAGTRLWDACKQDFIYSKLSAEQVRTLLTQNRLSLTAGRSLLSEAEAL